MKRSRRSNKRIGVKFEYVPILLGGIFKATNNKSPAETLAGIKNKREHQAVETERFVKRYGVKPYIWNPFFPVNTLNLMRAAVAAQMEGVFEKYVDAAFHHMWGEPKKMDDPEVAMKALTESGLDAAKLFARAQEPDVKAKLIENTQSAVERGAFGSPTFFVGKEMFFGKEQLREVEEMVAGVEANYELRHGEERALARVSNHESPRTSFEASAKTPLLGNDGQHRENADMQKRNATVAVIGAGDYIGAEIVKKFAVGRLHRVRRPPQRRQARAAGQRGRGRRRHRSSRARSMPARKTRSTRFLQDADKHAPLEVTIFNVGANVNFPILETTDRVFRKVWEMACWAGFLAGRESARLMLPRARATSSSPAPPRACAAAPALPRSPRRNSACARWRRRWRASWGRRTSTSRI